MLTWPEELKPLELRALGTSVELRCLVFVKSLVKDPSPVTMCHTHITKLADAFYRTSKPTGFGWRAKTAG